MDTQEKQKLYVLFGIFGVTLLIVYFNFLLKPQFQKFIGRNKDYISIKARVKTAELLIAREPNIRREFDNLKKRSWVLEKKFPQQEEISSILESFSQVAEASKVQILKIKPLRTVVDENALEDISKIFSEFPILIEARAGYHQCGEFISKLESMDRFIEIANIDIRNNPDDPRKHDMRLKVLTYVME